MSNATREDCTYPPVAGSDSSRHRRWLILGVLLAGQFLANVDTAVVNVAGPAIQDDLHASGSHVTLAISGYVVAYGVLLVTGARLGDTRGHRQVFVAGTTLFTAASLACGMAPSSVTLIVARFVQGAGAAFLVPQVLSGIQSYFSGTARLRALGYYAMALSGGAVVGQVLGGALIEADLFGLKWRSVFLLNVPVGLVLVVAARRWVPAGTRGVPARLDRAGVVLLSATVGLLITPLVLGPGQHWPAWTWAALGASLVLGAVFVRAERALAARGERPLVAPAVLRPVVVRWALMAHGLTTLTYFVLLFVLALYLQHGLGLGPAYAGAAMLSWVAAFGAAGAVTTRFSEQHTKHAAVAGCFLLASCYAAVCCYLQLGHRSGAGLIALLTVGGLGLGLSSNGLINRMTSATEPRHAADLSGVVSTNAQLCGAIGVAGLGAVYLALTSDGDVDQSVHALTVTLIACTSLALIAALAARQADRHISTSP